MNQSEPISILVFFGLVVIVLIVVLSWGARRSQGPTFLARLLGLRQGSTLRRTERRPDVWSEVALRLGAELMVGPGGHRVRFKWQGRDAMLFEGDPVLFEVAGADFGSLRADLRLGSGAGRRLPGIPDAITSSGGNEAELLAFLTAPVTQLLRDLLASGAGEVGMRDGLRVTARLRRTPDAVVRFSVLCLKLAQHVRMFSAQTSGVFVVETQTSSVGQCQICGAALEGVLVRCARCSTPHHADCWTYAGACSTYGCGEKRSVA